MNLPVLIGINGVARSGKDTAAAHIRELCTPRTMEKHGFADKLKLSAARALGFDVTLEEALALADRLKVDGTILVTWNDGRYPSGSQKLRVQSVTGRQYYQRFGSEAGRDIHGEDLWVDALLPMAFEGKRGLRERFPGIDFIVIPDVRYQNEAQRILALGGVVWEISAVGRLAALADKHASEQPLPRDLVSLVVPNNGTIEDFKGEVEAAFFWTTTR